MEFFFIEVDPKGPMKRAFDKFGLDQNTTDFIGHAMCLYKTDEYVCHYIEC